jgi:cytochrome c
MLRTSLTIAAAAGLLAACGHHNETGSAQAPAASGAAPAEGAAPTSAQVKALLATLPAPYASGDVDNGRRVFIRCQACHTATEGGPNLMGPNLWGLFGRKVASKADFNYSDALKAQSWTWDAQHLDAWIKDPRKTAPGTNMSFAGVPDDKDRIDVIAYLKTVTSK